MNRYKVFLSDRATGKLVICDSPQEALIRAVGKRFLRHENIGVKGTNVHFRVIVDCGKYFSETIHAYVEIS